MSDRCSLRHAGAFASDQQRLDPLARERHGAQPHTCCIEHRVGQCGSYRAGGGLTGAKRGLVDALHQFADRPEHLVENVKALEIRFTPDDLTQIDNITLVDEDRTVAPAYRALRPEKVHEFGPMQAARRRD